MGDLRQRRDAAEKIAPALRRLAVFFIAVLASLAGAGAPSTDRQSVIWREPQVRYLLADMTLNGGRTELYRKYAAEERDPDAREAVRLSDAGVRLSSE